MRQDCLIMPMFWNGLRALWQSRINGGKTRPTTKF
jgi:hypothetical protein